MPENREPLSPQGTRLHARGKALLNEQRLTYANVSRLVAYWTSLPTGGSLFSSPVVADGVLPGMVP